MKLTEWLVKEYPQVSPIKRKTLDQVVWPKVQTGNQLECWNWIGAANHLGYGQVRYHGRYLRATLAVWMLTGRDAPEPSQQLCHRCDNPPCVNPAHLFIGTAGDNMRDCVSKGRFKFPEPRRGELNNKAKLTEAKCQHVRELRQSGVSVSDISRNFGVARSTIREVLANRCWRDEAAPLQPKGKPTTGNSRIDNAEAVQLYKAGVSSADLAKRYGVSHQHMSIHLLRLGARKKGAPRHRRKSSTISKCRFVPDVSGS